MARREDGPTHALPGDEAACRRLMRGGSRTFFMASLLLPATVRQPATALYAFCRLADDLVDLSGGADAALVELGRRLDAVYAGNPLPIAADRALADVVRRFALPRDLLDALIEGFAWDARGRRYETMAGLEAYAVRVAGTVGVMMALLMDVRDPRALARAADLGVAMQLTNVARDIGEDARNGRLYLPVAWLREAGIAPERWVERPVFEPALAGVVGRLLARADALYERAVGGIALLPASCRPAILAARLIYAEIGRELEARGRDSVTARAVVPTRRKLALLARAMAGATTLRAAAPAAVLPQALFLLDAVACAPPTSPHARGEATPIAWWNIDRRIGRVIELFERLERRDRMRAHGLEV